MFSKLMVKFQHFMYGRYGNDSFGFFLIIFSLILTFVSNFFRGDLNIVFYLIDIFSTILIVFAIFRIFSKNINKRRNENNKFSKIWYPIKNRFKSKTAKMKDTTHKYFKCSKCSQQVRVPAGRGKIEICCPKCGFRFIKKS
ncbi:MAG: hypothetical protein RR549_00860 [Oscillospiraceae bacterium]